MIKIVRLALALGLSGTLAGCVAYADDYGYGGRGGGGYHGHEAPIPAGHLPPPGECRDWDPRLPPGQQPPPYKC